MLKTMKRGSVLVDIAIDQGGCFETSHATTHADPVYEVDGIIHYCVANMPGAVARTSTFALNNATLPFALKLANLGAEEAMGEDPHLAEGLSVSGGKIRHQPVAEALGLPYCPLGGLSARSWRRRLRPRGRHRLGRGGSRASPFQIAEAAVGRPERASARP